MSSVTYFNINFRHFIFTNNIIYHAMQVINVTSVK